ncbi:DUF6891 domain-containing protein [Streptomyces sp. NPDC004111]|uniref:DUF6891 domain-containing protein n=1 Tax=Streptomyces sp. NPDC004111 TaxID=3364690 RepID=UPI00368021CC
MSDRLEVTVQQELGAPVVRPSAAELTALVHRIGADGDRFLVVEPIPDDPQTYVQVWHATGGGYDLEHRAGGPAAHYGAELSAPAPVAAVMCRWAAGEEHWDRGVTWEHQDHGTPESEPVPELPDELHARVAASVRELLVGGYRGPALLVRAVEDIHGDEVSAPQAWQVVNRLWAQRIEEQREWGAEKTDPERLSEAFGVLDAAGIIAREDFTCCRSCGLAEIGGEGPEDSRGFVFFHTQGTAAAAAGGGLSLYYGGFADSPEVTASVGREVVAALGAAGLGTRWDGSPDRAIELTPLDWRRRLPG